MPDRRALLPIGYCYGTWSTKNKRAYLWIAQPIIQPKEHPKYFQERRFDMANNSTQEASHIGAMCFTRAELTL